MCWQTGTYLKITTYKTNEKLQTLQQTGWNEMKWRNRELIKNWRPAGWSVRSSLKTRHTECLRVGGPRAVGVWEGRGSCVPACLPSFSSSVAFVTLLSGACCLGERRKICMSLKRDENISASVLWIVSLATNHSWHQSPTFWSVRMPA